MKTPLFPFIIANFVSFLIGFSIAIPRHDMIAFYKNQCSQRSKMLTNAHVIIDHYTEAHGRPPSKLDFESEMMTNYRASMGHIRYSPLDEGYDLQWDETIESAAPTNTR